MDWSVWVNCGLLVAFFVWLFWWNGEKPTPVTTVTMSTPGAFPEMEALFFPLEYKFYCNPCLWRAGSTHGDVLKDTVLKHFEDEHPELLPDIDGCFVKG